MKEQKTLKIHIPVKPSTKANLEKLAQRDDVSLAHIVRKAIKEMLAKEESNVSSELLSS